MMSPVSTNRNSLPEGGQLAFFRRIAHDGRFRAKLETDPRAALAEYGLHVDPQDTPERVSLPGLEELGEGLDLAPIEQRWAGLFRL